jgi:endonuclease/exonuclease/phosphatase family metal-dependent hydrolase
VVDLSPLVDADLRGHFLPTIITMADGRDVLVLNMYLPVWSDDGAIRKGVMALIRAWWWKHGVELGLPTLMVGDVNAGWVSTDRKGGVRNYRDQHYKTWVGEMRFLPFDTRKGRPHTFHKGPMGLSRIDDWLYWVPSNIERPPPFPNSQVVVLEEIPCGSDHYPLQLTFGEMAAGQPIEVEDGVGECCVEQTGDGGDSCDEGYASGESSDDCYLSDEGYTSGD